MSKISFKKNLLKTDFFKEINLINKNIQKNIKSQEGPYCKL